MASLSMADMMSRTAPMAESAKKKNWIKAAVPKERRGVFKEKAKEAGMSTSAYAKKEEGASGSLGKEARLAENLMGMSHKRKKKSPLYTNPRSRHD